MTEPTITPHLSVNGAADAAEFYKKAFGATETFRLPADDGKRMMHVELRINGQRFFLCDYFPEYADQCGGDGEKVGPPDIVGGSTVTIHLEVENCDAAFKQAVDAGATAVLAPWDAFWGARYARITDPFGHAWSLAHNLPGAQAS